MNIAVRASAGSRISEAAIKKAIWSVKETDPGFAQRARARSRLGAARGVTMRSRK
jgi:hypothetical protein